MDTGEICRYTIPPVFAFFKTERATGFLIVFKFEIDSLAGSGLNLTQITTRLNWWLFNFY